LPNVCNAWGLCDMHGNVWEWVWDRLGPYAGDAVDPLGPLDPFGARVVRGGSWHNAPRYCRAANRHRFTPGNRYAFIGFRPARTVR